MRKAATVLLCIAIAFVLVACTSDLALSSSSPHSIPTTSTAAPPHPTLAPHDHNWQDATCTTPKTCITCGTTEGDTIAHSYQETARREPTSNKNGSITYSCVCGDTYEEVLKATGSVGLEYNHNGDGTCAVIGMGTCSDTDVCIPESFEGSTVTSISNHAFYGCSNLTSIVLPDSVTDIGEYTFQLCNNLTSINIPEGVTSIGYNTFSGCENLQSIALPDSISTIHKSAFSRCYNLHITCSPNSNFTFSDGILYDNPVTEIICVLGHAGNISILEGITKIEDGTFSSYLQLTGITIPESVTSIGDHAFRGCTSLSSITIPESVTSIGYGAFMSCTSLSSITIPNSVTTIGSYAFDRCSKMSSITLPEGVTSIGDWAFRDCSGLTSITIPASITSIARGLFSGCTGLTTITIPDSVTTIEPYAFDGCSNLISIVCSANGHFHFSDGILYNNTVTEIIWVLESISGDVSILPGITKIHQLLFCERTKIISITIPQGVTTIDEQAFYGCSNLTSITIPNSVTTIGSHAFNGCSKMSSITLPEGVTSIGDWAFRDCSGLTSITIPASITSIGRNVFDNCNLLREIHYSGTTEQWNSIPKGYAWDGMIDKYTIYCINGEIKK